MLGLLQAGLLPVFADFGIPLALGDSGHGQIHADLRALALKVGAQTGNDFLANFLGNLVAEDLADADHMLGGPAQLLSLQGELAAGNLADRALLGGRVALMNITTYGTYPFFHWNSLLTV